MTISTTRNLSQLAELMGNDYTEADAAKFAAHLIEQYGVADTDELGDNEWLEALAEWDSPTEVTYRIRGTHPDAQTMLATVTESEQGVFIEIDKPHQYPAGEFRCESMADWLNHHSRLGWVWVRLDGKAL